MSELESRQTEGSQENQLVRRRNHYLVVVNEKRIGIGRFGFQSGVKGQTVVDVGNAKTEEQAKSTAIARYAKKTGVNPILVSVSEVQKVEPAKAEVDRAFSVMDLDRLASAVGAGNEASVGCLTVKVRRA